MNIKELFKYYKTLSKEEVQQQMNKLDNAMLDLKLNPNLTFKEAQELLKLPPIIEECIKCGIEMNEEEKKIFKNRM